MCAILVLGIGLVGLSQGITTALSSSKEAELQTTAALLAAGQIEGLRAEGFLSEGTSEGEGEGSFAAYKWKMTVTRARIEGLYEVEVVVSRAKSGESIYELRTLLFEPSDYSTLENTTPRKDTTRSRRPDRRRR